jgi:hypothetical protein
MIKKHTKTHYIISAFTGFLSDYLNTYQVLVLAAAMFGLLVFFPPIALALFGLGILTSGALLVYHMFKEHKQYKKDDMEETKYDKLSEKSKEMRDEIKKQNSLIKTSNANYALAQKKHMMLTIIDGVMDNILVRDMASKTALQINTNYPKLKEIIDALYKENITDEDMDEHLAALRKIELEFPELFSSDFAKTFNNTEKSPSLPREPRTRANKIAGMKVPSTIKLMVKTAIQTTALTITIIALTATLVCGLAPAVLFMAAPLIALGVSVAAIGFGILVSLVIGCFFKRNILPHLHQRNKIAKENASLEAHAPGQEHVLGLTKKHLNAEEKSLGLAININQDLQMRCVSKGKKLSENEKKPDESLFHMPPRNSIFSTSLPTMLRKITLSSECLNASDPPMK